MRPVILQEPFRAVFYTPYYVALAHDDFAAEGVPVQRRDGGDPAASSSAVLSGAADVTWGGPMRVLLAHDADPNCPLRLFAAAILGDPFLLVGREPRPDFRLTDLATLTLGSVAEVPTPWWTLQDDLRRAGLDPTTVRRVTGRTMAENAAAVAAGTLDVAQLFEPYVTAMEQAGTGHVWYAAADRGPTSYTCFYATAERIAALRPEFLAMTRSMARALAWLAAASPEEVAAAIAGFFPDLAPALLAACIGRYKRLGIWTPDPRFPPEPFERLEAAMLSAGAIRRAPGYATCVDESLATEAL